MIDTLLIFVGGFGLIWGMVYFFQSLIYSFGDRKHVNYLVDNLAKEPKIFKEKHYVSMVSIGAGGLLIIFGLVYPFIRHRRRDKKLSFDVFMWLNWIFSVTVIAIYISGKVANS